MIISATQIKISHCSQECGLTVCIMPGFCTELQLVRSGEKKRKHAGESNSSYHKTGSYSLINGHIQLELPDSKKGLEN